MEYYYEQLNKAEQKAYHAIRVGLESLAPSFPVPRLDGKELADLYFKVRLDHPKIFYTETFKYRYYEDSANVEMIPEYIFPKGKILEHGMALEARVRKLARQAQDLSEKDKELFVHDFMCQSVKYDKLKKPYSHEIIGPLGHGIGVCEGIAKSVKVLCDALGIWCMIVVSEANPEKNVKYRHAWNIIRLDGKYYHMDATFDNTISRDGILRYDYLNLSDKQILKDHEPMIWKAPSCENGEHFYYRERKLSFTKYEDVRKRAAQAVKKGKPLIFHWRGGYLTQSVVKDLVELFHEEAQKKEKFACVSLNVAQAVVQVRFEKQITGQELVIEEINEEGTL